MKRAQTLTSIHGDRPMRVSAYDVVVAFLNAAIVVLASCVAILFFIWLNSLVAPHPIPQPDHTRKKPDKDRERAVPLSHDLSAPSPSGLSTIEPEDDELPETRPPAFAKILEAVVTTVSTVKGDLVSASEATGASGATSDGRMPGPGAGSNGIGGDGTTDGAGPPVTGRWEIDYEFANLDEYRQFLESFSIELGVVDPDSNSIKRIRMQSPSPTVLDSSRSAEANSFYFVPRRSVMRRWDAALARQAGVPLDGHFIVQFYPDALRERLSQLETVAATEAGIETRAIRRTVFRARRGDAGFEFSIRQIDPQ